MKVKGLFYDIKGTDRILKLRHKNIQKSSEEGIKDDPIKNLSEQLHPDKILLKIVKIEDYNGKAKTFTFKVSEKSKFDFIPVFQAGQYISFKFNIGKSYVTRPYSISSAPCEAIGTNGEESFVQVTIKKKEKGFVCEYVWNNWQIGTEVEAVMPLGNFYYEPLRDYKTIVALAGGSGITHFHSMAREIVYGDLKAKMKLIYGSKSEKHILFKEEFEKLQKESNGNFQVINVLSNKEDSWTGESGFITSDIIKKYCNPKKSSFFICGPQVMYKFIEKEISKLNLKRKQIRREVFGEVEDVYSLEDFKKYVKDKCFNMKVNIGEESIILKAHSSESVLTALEREGIKHDSHCRSGECGFCRSKLIKGKVYVVSENDGRREADKIEGYFHPCSSYPVSDIEIKIPQY
ncbi:2Fe-2S iron-sulfur cluster binding domain-containing protein [Clostridium botulinum]|nr:2Fe-2S iron-sulfur cluster binding domain-containing protein [Clostridium botulinum]